MPKFKLLQTFARWTGLTEKPYRLVESMDSKKSGQLTLKGRQKALAKRPEDVTDFYYNAGLPANSHRTKLTLTDGSMFVVHGSIKDALKFIDEDKPLQARKMTNRDFNKLMAQGYEPGSSHTG